MIADGVPDGHLVHALFILAAAIIGLVLLSSVGSSVLHSIAEWWGSRHIRREVRRKFGP